MDMITPLEIQKKEFGKSLRGYNEDEVDQFLDSLCDTVETLTNENHDLKDKLEMLQGQLEKYAAMEKTLNETLIIAQRTADDVNKTAELNSRNIIKEAKLEAERIVAEANKKVESIQNEMEIARRELKAFKARFKAMLNTQLGLIDDSDVDY
jgi:cell division initiation protein